MTEEEIMRETKKNEKKEEKVRKEVVRKLTDKSTEKPLILGIGGCYKNYLHRPFG